MQHEAFAILHCSSLFLTKRGIYGMVLIKVEPLMLRKCRSAFDFYISFHEIVKPKLMRLAMRKSRGLYICLFLFIFLFACQYINQCWSFVLGRFYYR